MANAIQYRGLNAIMQAFDSVKIPAWALLYGKQVVGKHAGRNLDESREELEQLLKQLQRSNTTAQYTLSFYEGVDDKKKIKASTEPDISKNVVIWDQDNELSPAAADRRSGYMFIADRLEQMDAKIAGLQKEDEGVEDEEDGQDPQIGSASRGIMGKLELLADRILENPEVQHSIGQRFVSWMDRFFSPSPTPPMNTQQQQLGSMGDIPQAQITQDQADKIQRSIAILAAVDPQLGDHLEQISNLAQKNPNKYRSLITMLNTFL